MEHFSIEFKQQVIDDYNSGKYGGRPNLAKHYNISKNTIWHWIEKDRKQGNQMNDIENKRGHQNCMVFRLLFMNMIMILCLS